jgi:hypothetical protein
LLPARLLSPPWAITDVCDSRTGLSMATAAARCSNICWRQVRRSSLAAKWQACSASAGARQMHLRPRGQALPGMGSVACLNRNARRHDPREVGARLAGTGRRCPRRAGRFLKDRLALGRRPLSSRPGAWASLQARASGARSARGLLVGGEEVGAARHAPADAAALRLRRTRLVGREPRLRTVRPRLSGPLSAPPLRGSRPLAGRNDAKIACRDSAWVGVARRRHRSKRQPPTSSTATACGRRACRLPR